MLPAFFQGSAFVFGEFNCLDFRHKAILAQFKLILNNYLALHIFFNRDPPMQYVFTILVLGVLGFVWLLLLRWAWNRRADRLNREASLPQPELAVDTGIWPPPPTLSAPADAPPRR